MFLKPLVLGSTPSGVTDLGSNIQAQHDFFGAHTYHRMDKEGVFHTQWE